MYGCHLEYQWLASLSMKHSSEVSCGVQSALRTIVFCNKIETCRKVENVLKRSSPQGEEGTLVLPYHAAIEEGQRVKNLKVDPTSLKSL